MVIDRAFGDRVDVPELGVTVGVMAALPCFDVRLEAVAKTAQKPRDRREMHLVTPLAQPRGQVADAPRGPAQKRLRVAAAVGIDEPLEIPRQRRVDLAQPLAAPARPTHPTRREPLPRLELSNPLPDRVERHPRRTRRHRDPAPASRPRLARRPQPTLTLVQLASQHPELLPDQDLITHNPSFHDKNADPAMLFNYRP